MQHPVARWLVPESFCLLSAYPLFRGLLECFRVVQALAALFVYLHPVVRRGGLTHTILWACELVMGRHFSLFDGMDVSTFWFSLMILWCMAICGCQALRQPGPWIWAPLLAPCNGMAIFSIARLYGNQARGLGCCLWPLTAICEAICGCQTLRQPGLW